MAVNQSLEELDQNIRNLVTNKNLKESKVEELINSWIESTPNTPSGAAPSNLKDRSNFIKN